MAQADLFPVGAVDAPLVVGDELDRMLTPDPLALACVERMLLRCPTGAFRVTVEPSCGGGAFVRAVHKRLRRAFVVGVDIDPAARGLEACDHGWNMDTEKWVELLLEFKGVDSTPFDGSSTHAAALPFVVVGNVPFGSDLDHVRALLELRPYRLATILPWDRIGQKRWHETLWREPVPGMAWREVHPIRPRPWGAHVRETALYVWGHAEPRCQRVIGDPIIWKAAA